MRRRLGLLGIAVVVAIAASLALGARQIELATLLDAILQPDPDSTDHLVVRELRWPRTVLGLAVGAALGVAGSVTQTVTHNPLGDPGVLGVNAGAALSVVVGISVFDLESADDMVWFGFLGAALAAVIVYGLGASAIGPVTPARLALAGAAVAALFISLTSTVVLLDNTTIDRFRFWIVGSLADRGDNVSVIVMTPIVIGLVLALALARQLDTLALGDDTATSLGAAPARIRAVALLVVALLSGAAVAAAGPIAFVGLIAPHAVRRIIGLDHRAVLPASALFGATLLLTCDVVSRLVMRPAELRVGIITAAIGGPFFVVIARRTRTVPLR